MPTPTALIGHVTRERYEQIIAGDRELVGQMQRIQFTIGDHALEIEPMQKVGGAHPAPGEDLFGVDVSLQIYADDLGLSLVRSAATGSPLTAGPPPSAPRMPTTPSPLRGCASGPPTPLGAPTGHRDL